MRVARRSEEQQQQSICIPDAPSSKSIQTAVDSRQSTNVACVCLFLSRLLLECVDVFHGRMASEGQTKWSEHFSFFFLRLLLFWSRHTRAMTLTSLELLLFSALLLVDASECDDIMTPCSASECVCVERV